MEGSYGEILALVRFVGALLAGGPFGFSPVSNRLADTPAFPALRNCGDWRARIPSRPVSAPRASSPRASPYLKSVCG